MMWPYSGAHAKAAVSEIERYGSHWFSGLSAVADADLSMQVGNRQPPFTFPISKQIYNPRSSIIMKLALAFTLSTSVAAFTVAPSFSSFRSTTSLSARPDSSAAIQQAMEISKTYGASSPEAAVAWDAIEEMDASDNRYVEVISLQNQELSSVNLCYAFA
jgi:hypothetical protein